MMTRLDRALRLDRKGHGLLLMAAVWALIGLGTSEAPAINSAWHQAIPDAILTAGWAGSAAIAALAAWWKSLRPWAMGALIFLPGIRCVSYLTAWVIALTPGGEPGYDRGWLAAAQQVLMVAFVFFVASDQRDTTVEDLAHVLRSTTDGADR